MAETESVFGCHCENSFPDTHNNIQCSRCRLFYHGACYSIYNTSSSFVSLARNKDDAFVCGSCGIKEDILCSNQKMKMFYQDKEKMSREELEDFKYQGLVSRALQSFEEKEHHQFLGSSKPDFILFLRFRFGLSREEARTLFDRLHAEGALDVDANLSVVAHWAKGKVGLESVAKEPIFSLILQNLDPATKRNLRLVNSTLKTRVDELDILYPVIKMEYEETINDPPVESEFKSSSEEVKLENKDWMAGKASANSEKIYACDLCDFVGKTAKARYSHKMKMHTKWLQCDQCEYSIYCSFKMKQHKECVHLKKKYKCDQCDFAATQKSTVAKHILSVHEEQKFVYSCDECTYKTKLQKNLSSHKKNRHDVTKPPAPTVSFICEHCPYTTKVKQNLKKHTLHVHGNVEKYPCDQCVYISKSAARLTVHKFKKHGGKGIESSLSTECIEDVNGLKVSVFSCDHCDYVGPDALLLRRHKSSKHNEGHKYLCDECDFMTAFHYRLKEHKLNKHQGVSYQCDQCELSFPNKDHLKQHSKCKHEGIRYSCDQCPSTFSYKGDLTRHVSSRHKQ